MILPFPFAELDQQKAMAEIEIALARPFTPPNWANHWDAVLRKFEDSGYDLQALQPAFVNRSTTLRWQGKYIEAPANAEQLFIDQLRRQLFEKYLSDIDHFYEFGSGSACNVAAYAQQYPQIPITACDFSPAAVRIADLLAEHHGMKVEGRLFDMKAPKGDLEPGSGVLTWCAMEQLGEDWKPFLDFLIANKPKRVVHVEPMSQLYKGTPFDRLALQYHRIRDYLSPRFIKAVHMLDMQGKIRLLHCERTGFGSRFHEGYSITVFEMA